MRIYTSYFGNIRRLPTDLVCISICGKAPNWYEGLQYKVVAPKYKFFMEWKENKDNDFYIEHFNKEVLDMLSVKKVYDDLEKMTKGRDCVLLCYERPEDFCHRHLVAKWLEDNLNISVIEL